MDDRKRLSRAALVLLGALLIGLVGLGTTYFAEPKVEESPAVEPQEDEGQKPLDRVAPDDVPPLDGALGDYGRLIIPKDGYSAAVYYSLDDDEAQAIVDEEDSALASRRREDHSTLTYADHTNQGFSTLYTAEPGETRAYLYTPEHEVILYECTDRFQGHNNLVYLTDEEGRDLSYAPTDAMMYTCNETWENVTITYWRVVGTYPAP